MHTDMTFTPEFILSILLIIFTAGGIVFNIKRLGAKAEENEKILQNVLTRQYVQDEKISRVDEKLNKVEIQIESKMAKMELLNSEILKIVTQNQHGRVI